MKNAKNYYVTFKTNDKYNSLTRTIEVQKVKDEQNAEYVIQSQFGSFHTQPGKLHGTPTNKIEMISTVEVIPEAVEASIETEVVV